MQLSVSFQGEDQTFEVADDRLVAHWAGPPGGSDADCSSCVETALESPRDFPPLRQAVVPGDRVVVAWDPSLGECPRVVQSLTRLFEQAGVERDFLKFLTLENARQSLERVLPPGVDVIVHDPDDRSQLAYLAATKEGRRIYLNRWLTDADLVVPVGRLGFDSINGFRGPWTALFPLSSDRESWHASRELVRDEAARPTLSDPPPFLEEAFEVSWLLGAQFHLGIVPGASGVAEIVAGIEHSVRAHGILALERLWTFAVESTAELVVVGVGRPGIETTLDDLAEALAVATPLVTHGGKIAVLSRTRGDIGPALRMLMELDNPKTAASALRGQERSPDFIVARRLAQALERADVFLLSELSRSTVEDLSIMSLENSRQVQKLVGQSNSCSFLSHAELTRASLAGAKQS
jgi:hypothetical protein